MASLGHPLIGDATYGGSATPVLQRQALHAYRLALAHPISGVALDFISRLPADFAGRVHPTGPALQFLSDGHGLIPVSHRAELRAADASRCRQRSF
jgi:hypothetical protein